MREPVYQQFGARIRGLRKALGWSQEELSVRVGCSRPSIANIEIGRQRVTLHDIETFARAFQTTARHLIKDILT